MGIKDFYLDQATLKTQLDYDPETGHFTWKIARAGRPIGSRAGCKNGMHRQVSVKGVLHAEHRLAWLYHYGEWPQENMDHINRDGHDNRIANLRLATQGQNSQNQPPRLMVNGKPTTSKYLGVCYCASKSGNKKWQANIGLAGVKIRRYFYTELEAKQYRDQLKAQLHTFNPRDPDALCPDSHS